MSYEDTITSYHLDILREIGNIGAGHAATALSTLLGNKVDMSVPHVKVVSFDEMMEMAGGPENVVVSVFLRIEGEMTGSMFFILSIEQASGFIRTMIKDDSFNFEQIAESEMGLSALQEMGNILSGSYLSSLSDFTNLNLYPTVPAIAVDMAGAIISYGLVEVSQAGDKAIVIDTELANEGKKTEGANGQFFLLPDPDSFRTLFHALGVE
ncbi:chemotaxis protein CheC [Jeotgalibacillus sp. R-1-5s-1]|uniref:chemotaxis protein CheC n=1 Tax=Jeotgalibacillus sp. R-1-5s-1 TaxID=2555897 RepID=UPI00106C41FA|nr:chemotaxis protein CheC [Jeotgalibacillus sp. R-1-5s-1]TFE03477.1 chemotaxis protein CheC [Jeotgalibacillus sp. R-1-5s-1]